jgi:hypothetical protein
MLAVSRSDSLSDPSDFCTRGVETMEDIFCLIYLYTDLLLLPIKYSVFVQTFGLF